MHIYMQKTIHQKAQQIQSLVYMVFAQLSTKGLYTKHFLAVLVYTVLVYTTRHNSIEEKVYTRKNSAKTPTKICTPEQ